MVRSDEESRARQPFLGQDDKRLDDNIGLREDGEEGQTRPHTPLLSRKSYVPIIAHVIVLAIYSYIFIYVVASRDKSCASCGSLIYCTRMNQCINLKKIREADSCSPSDGGDRVRNKSSRRLSY